MPRGIDAVNYPENTESGERTDEYIVRTARGYISPSEEDLGNRSGATTIAESHTMNSSSSLEKRVNGSIEEKKAMGISDVEGASEIKLVTWKVDDPEDPRTWSKSVKWSVTPCAWLDYLGELTDELS